MPIVLRCGGCGAVLRFRDDALGKKAKCIKCSHVVQIVPNGESRNSGEPAEAVVADSLTDAGTTRASPAKRETVTPKPRRESDEAAESTGDADGSASAAKMLMSARPKVRLIVLVLLLVPIFLASRLSLAERLLSCVVPLVLTGTYRISSFRGDRFRTRFHIAFFPVSTHRCNLRGVSFINAKYGHEGSGFGTFLLFGPAQVVFGRVFDYLLPSVGGPYQLHLVTAKGRELVAWQGFNEEQFRGTLDLLVSLTNAELRSM